MRYDLGLMVKRAKKLRRKSIPLRVPAAPNALATSLYQTAYAPILKAWADFTPRIMAEYERSLSAITTDSAADVEREIETAEQTLSRIILMLTPRLNDWAYRVESWQRGKWRGAVLSATGVDVGTMIGPTDMKEALDTLIARNAALVKDVSAQARNRIATATLDGLRNRTPARIVAGQIRDAVAMGRDRSLRIASDQLSKASSALAAERRREAGIDAWQWVHSGKLRPRPDHKARDGKRYTDKTAPVDKPGQLPFCGCRELALLEI
jgi:SPP1 gp7 family putative phage head morphogenesis protein